MFDMGAIATRIHVTGMFYSFRKQCTFRKKKMTGRMAWLFQARDANYSLLAEVADDKLCLPSLEQLGAAKQLPQRTFVVLC